MITVKNVSLRKKVFKQMRILHLKAVKAYERGDMKTGRKLEKLNDNIYKKNYYKMFDVRAENKR